MPFERLLHQLEHFFRGEPLVRHCREGVPPAIWPPPSHAKQSVARENVSTPSVPSTLPSFQSPAATAGRAWRRISSNSTSGGITVSVISRKSLLYAMICA